LQIKNKFPTVNKENKLYKHLNKLKDTLKETRRNKNKLEEKFLEERNEFRQLLSMKDEEIQHLKHELDKHKCKSNDFDTLTTNNDPYALKQEIQDLNI
jgi:septal ring factor EnvC (AmiA/AmiB activator)